MRIAILSPSFPPNLYPCGIGDFTTRLAPELKRLDVESVIFTSSDYGGPAVCGQIPVRRIARRWTPGALAHLARAAREEKVHALLVQYAPDLYPPGTRWVCFLPLVMRILSPGIPVVLSIHTVGVSTFSSMVRVAMLMTSARAILSTNEEAIHLIGKYLKPLLGKTLEIPIGANVEPPPGWESSLKTVRGRVRTEWDIPPDASLLAHFGFYYPGKGAEQILEAAAKWKAAGRAFRLFMLGGDRFPESGYYKNLQSRACAEGLEEEIRWTGYMEGSRLSEILRASDLFLAPYEGGISSRRGSLMAGIAHGLPIISTPSKIPTRYFREGENFAAVPFGDAGALAAQVEALMDDPAARARLRAGTEALAASFAWPAIAGRTRAFLLSVLRSAPMNERDLRRRN